MPEVTNDDARIRIACGVTPVTSGSGCYSGSIENRPCGPDGGCLAGYVCSTAGLCVASDSAPPSALQYSVTPAVYTKGLTISPNTPTASGGPATRYAVWPALPDGIALDASSGVISGTPAAITPATPYAVTAANAAGEATTVITIAVNDIAPSDLRYSTNPVIYTKGIPSPANWPVSAGGDVVAYQLSPELPAGLRLDVTTGIITGTPRDVSAPAAYAVTATNSGGSTSAVITISVNPAVNNAGDGAAPANLSYRDNPAVFTKGVAIDPAHPSATAGPATAFSISPLLPGGLLLNGVTGVISGVPTEVSPTTTYVVTASNSAGSTTVALTLTVRDAAAAEPHLRTQPRHLHQGSRHSPQHPQHHRRSPHGVRRRARASLGPGARRRYGRHDRHAHGGHLAPGLCRHRQQPRRRGNRHPHSWRRRHRARQPCLFE